jgi:7-carboxy-7-deazaguanine synthase
MRIAEIYASLQGEGLLAGTPSGFVRASGCNLRCHWCDTPFASWEPEGDDWPVPRILEELATLDSSHTDGGLTRHTDGGLGRHAVITGGEPLIFADTVALCRALRQAGWHVTIETAGTVLPPGVAAPDLADLMSISPKLASSAPPAGAWRARHEAARRDDTVLAALMTASHQLKFVIDSPADFTEACRWIDDLVAAGAPVDRRTVFMMPQGRTTAELDRTGRWLLSECRRAGFCFGPRHHIAWFGDVRGT